MVVSLVRTAIQTKCRYDNARMTGNYECAYALGILKSQEGTITELKSVYDKVISGISAIQTDDKKIQQLIAITSDYEVTDKFDEQMNELYHMGYNDKNI